MTSKRGSKKPEKPYPEFPLTAHPNGQFCKRIRGKLRFFGPWADPDAALANYLDRKDDLHAGRELGGPAAQGATVGYLVDLFLTHKTRQLQANEIVKLTFEAYHRTALKVAEAFGAARPLADLRPADFERLRASLAETNGPRALAVEVQHVRSLFKYADESGLLERPMRFGPAFKAPSKAVIRKLRASKPARLFAAAELRQVLDAAGVQLKAIVLLGINCGFGNTDVARLPLAALDLAGGWVDYPRPKTGIARRCRLWPETVAALRQALRERPEPSSPKAAALVFLSRTGAPYNGRSRDSGLGDLFRRLLERCGVKRPGLSFYSLRHSFATIAEGCRDHVAVGAIMGHVDASIAEAYREKIDDSRLEAAAAQVRCWLFAP